MPLLNSDVSVIVRERRYSEKVMDQYEEAVLWYITAPRTRFICPQYDLAWEKMSGGSCPDFVVLDYEKTTIYVVEVSTAAQIAGLVERVTQRETRWYGPIQIQLGQLSPHFAEWQYRVSLFVRGEVADALRLKIAGWKDVSVLSLDEAVFGWRWKWEGKRAVNTL